LPEPAAPASPRSSPSPPPRPPASSPGTCCLKSKATPRRGCASRSWARCCAGRRVRSRGSSWRSSRRRREEPSLACPLPLACRLPLRRSSPLRAPRLPLLRGRRCCPWSHPSGQRRRTRRERRRRRRRRAPRGRSPSSWSGGRSRSRRSRPRRSAPPGAAPWPTSASTTLRETPRGPWREPCWQPRPAATRGSCWTFGTTRAASSRRRSPTRRCSSAAEKRSRRRRGPPRPLPLLRRLPQWPPSSPETWTARHPRASCGAPRSRARRWRSWSTPARPRAQRSSPARCATAAGPCSSGRGGPSGRGSSSTTSWSTTRGAATGAAATGGRTAATTAVSAEGSRSQVKKKRRVSFYFFHLRPPPSLASSCSSSFYPLAERTKKNDPNTPFVSHLVAGYSTPKGHDPSAEKGLEPQRWCSGHGSGPPGSSSWASFSSSSSAAAAEVEGDGCLLEALRSVDDEIDRAGGADAAAELARF